MREFCKRLAASRPSDVVIGGHDDPYMLRWFVIPRNPVFNIYLHHFLRSDDDRALHTHPWLFNCSILLEGQYLEHTPGGKTYRFAGDWKFRLGRATHRIELLTPLDRVTPMPCWTVFITGPRVRKWGFICPQGWVHWAKFTAPGDKGSVGKGCNQ